MVRALREASRRGVRRSGRLHHRTIHLAVDHLEPRTLLSNVSWTGKGDATSWTDASNWSDDAVPTASDDVTIDLSGNPTIEITTGTQSVNSVTSTDPISISGGSLSVAANSTLSGGLTMTGGSLSASGSDISLTVTGTTTDSGGSLNAENGARLSLSQLTSFTGNASTTTLEATGAGSTLTLANLASVTQPGNSYAEQAQFEALAGGTVTLLGLKTINTGTVILESDGTGSTLNVGALTSFTETGGWTYSTLQASNGGTVDDGKMTSLSSVNFNVAGPGEDLTLAGITSYGSGNITVSGGASLSLPGITSYTGNASTTTLEATGAGSTLTLANLASVTQPGNSYAEQAQFEALAGGTVKLPALKTINTGTVILESDGTGSTLNVPALTSFTETNGWTYSTLQTSNGGTVADSSSLTGLSNVDLNVGGPINLSGLTALSHVDLSVSGTGEKLTLTGPTSYGSGTITVNGGATLSLPTLTSVDGSTIEVNGGTLTLPALTGAENAALEVSGGGTLTLPAPTSFTAAGSTVTVTGTGSSVQIGSGVLDPLPTSGSNGTINVPAFPEGMIVDLNPNGTFSGGTTINVGADATVEIQSGIYTGGVTFNVGQGAVVNLTGGNTVTYGGALTGSGSGTVQFSGGGIDPAAGSGDGPTNAGVTLNFAGSIFQWTGGGFFASKGNVTNLGTINLAGSSDKGFYEDGTLYNEGTLIQTGTGNLDLHSDNVSPTTLVNDTGASYLIESDSGIDNGFGGQTSLVNSGTIRKTAGTGTSTLTIAGSLTNTGTIEAGSGTLDLEPASFAQFAGGNLTGGTWNALDGATLQFPGGTTITSNAATIALGGSGATIAALSGLASNSGSLSLTGGAGLTTSGGFSNSGNLTVGAGSTFKVGGTFTQTAAGSLAVQIGGTPSSGQYGHVAVTGSAGLGGNLDVSLVNGFNPTLGQDYPVLSYVSVTGAFAKISGLPSGMTATQKASALDLDTAAAGADLAVTSVSAPSTAAEGQAIAVSWQVKDEDATAAGGNWQDSVYLSPTSSITGSSLLLGTVVHTGGLGAGATYSGSLTTPVPALAPGSYYVFVEADSLYQVSDPNRANNALAATGSLAISLPSLTLGEAATGSFTAAEQENYYQVTVPAGGSLVVSAASAASSGALAVYVSQGTLPTPYNDQDASAIPNQPNQTAVVPQVLSAATYDILVESVSGAAATSGFTLTVTQGNTPTISSLSTTSGGNAGNLTVGIDGTNLAPTATATLTQGGSTISAASIDFVNASQIYATFDLKSATVGNYTLSVHQGSQAVTARSPLQVVAATAGTLSVSLSVPQLVRTGRTGTVVVNYANTSLNDIVAPLLTISSTNADVLFSTPDDPSDYVPSADVLAVAPSGPAGILRPGQSGQLSLTLLAQGAGHQSIPVEVAQIEAGQTIDWSSQESAIRPSTISTAAWGAIWTNLMAMVGTTTDSYDAALAHAATYLGGVGETTAQVSDVSRLWSFLTAQADAAFPTGTLTSATDASLPTPGGLTLAIGRSFGATIDGRSQPGPFGLGWTMSWQDSLSTDASGDVTIDSAGAFGVFLKQPNGTFLDTDGEFGALTQSGGIYTFTATSGTQLVFLANGQLNYEQDTHGNRITLGYNAQGHLSSLTYANPSDPSEPTESLTLTDNAQGFISQVADGTGDTWTYAYDPAGHLLSVTAPGNLKTSYTYATGSNPETANALLSITSPDGSQQDFTYDVQGRLSETSSNGGADPTIYTYDGQAEITTSDAAGDKTITWYDALGRAARVEDPLGGISSFTYNNNSNLAGYTNAAGDTYQYSYDASGNATQTVNPLGQTVSMTYDSLGNLTSVTDADNTTQYQYNAAGSLLGITYPDGTQQSFMYNPLGNMAETVEQDGDAVGYQYNAQGLVTQETFADKTSETFAYDAQVSVR